ncbi:MAG: hypothetical protein QOG85_1555 [Gaiellaceae bacterium]|nr:hypothetical protein [Gaiellaceae bacterium]
MTDGGYERKRSARRIFDRVEKSRGFGEQLQSAVWGHRYVPGLQLLLLFGALGDTLYLLIARPYFLALTDRNFMLLNGSRFGLVSKPRDAVFTVPASQVRIELGRKFVLRKVATVSVMGGEETKIAVHRQFWGELDHMASLLSGR